MQVALPQVNVEHLYQAALEQLHTQQQYTHLFTQQKLT